MNCVLDSIVNSLKIDVFVTCLLNFASKSMTHTFSSMAKYVPILQTLNKTEDNQICILNTILQVWQSHQQVF